MPEIDRELRALGESLAFPPTPDLASSVVARLPEPAPSGRPRWLVVVAAVVGIALIAGLAIPQARSAILRVFGIGSVRVEYVDALPAVKPETKLVLGREISRQDAPFHLLGSRLLGPPDGTYASGSVVTLLYGSSDDVRLLVTQIGRPALEPEIVKKILATTTNATVVQIEGSVEPALWIEGEPHVLALPGAPERLARNTLVWTHGNLTLRLEGAATLDQAIRIAQSFR